MNGMPKSEEPLPMIDRTFGLVPSNGFSWVSGNYGGSAGPVFKDKFLQRNQGVDTVVPLAADTYLDLISCDGNEPSFLEFAAKHGPLGCPRIHFHESETDLRQKRGEELSRWRFEWKRLRVWFEMFHLIKEQKESALRRLIQSDDELADAFAGYGKGAKLLDICPGHLVRIVNERMEQEIYRPAASCFVLECQRNSGGGIYDGVIETLGGVSYQLTWESRRRHFTTKLRAHRLIGALWLQFSELIAGERTIRRCEAPDCGKWMDISDVARKGSKRMHDRCSLRLRMRRYRDKGKDESK
jgi:hypothetical protein